jgi:hypothetical protein
MDSKPLPEVGPHEADVSQLLDRLPLLGADAVVAIASARLQLDPEERQAHVADAEARASESGREWLEATEQVGQLAEQLAGRHGLDPEQAGALRSALREAVLALTTWDLAGDEARDLFMPVAEFFPLAQSEKAG